MIRFSNVYKTYGDHAVLSDISFQVDSGETVVLMGPSGCGKTTLLRCINGLETVQKGQITVCDMDITHPAKGFNWNQFRAEIGMVFQQFNLFPHLTVLQNITLGPIHIKKVPKAEAEAQAEAILARMGLAEKARRYPNTLSGGEKQRVAIARALAMSARILLLDEPTSALDPLMTAEVLQTIRDLSEQGITMVIVTHHASFALESADRILFLDQGQIALQGPPERFTQALDHPIAQYYFERPITRA